MSMCHTGSRSYCSLWSFNQLCMHDVWSWGVSLHLGSSPNEFSWDCKFIDGMSIVLDLLYDLFLKLDDVSASLMQNQHLISNANYTTERYMLLAFTKMWCQQLICRAHQVSWNILLGTHPPFQWGQVPPSNEYSWYTLCIEYVTCCPVRVITDCEFSPVLPHVVCCLRIVSLHDNVIKWKHFPRYWPFVWGIHRSPVNSPHKGQWCGALMFSVICAWINVWVNIRKAGDFRCHHAHYDITVMT